MYVNVAYSKLHSFEKNTDVTQSYMGSGLKNVSLLNKLRGDGWGRPLKNPLVCRYGAVLQKIGLERNVFSVSLQNI